MKPDIRKSGWDGAICIVTITQVGRFASWNVSGNLSFPLACCHQTYTAHSKFYQVMTPQICLIQVKFSEIPYWLEHNPTLE